jgi:hypothetical protein
VTVQQSCKHPSRELRGGESADLVHGGARDGGRGADLRSAVMARTFFGQHLGSGRPDARFEGAEGDELDLGPLLAAFGPGDRTETSCRAVRMLREYSTASANLMTPPERASDMPAWLHWYDHHRRTRRFNHWSIFA